MKSPMPRLLLNLSIAACLSACSTVELTVQAPPAECTPPLAPLTKLPDPAGPNDFKRWLADNLPEITENRKNLACLMEWVAP